MLLVLGTRMAYLAIKKKDQAIRIEKNLDFAELTEVIKNPA
jgi:hypothetical protein